MDLLTTGEMGHFLRYSERRRMQFISRMVPASGVSRLLDAGCGTGELSGNLVNRGFNVIALDLGFESIHRAHAKYSKENINIPFVQGDVYRLPYKDGCFDAVVISEILEHLEKPQDALREAARILRPGGHIIVSTPYRESLRFTLCIHCNKKTPITAHLHSFDEKILKTMLNQAGFSVEMMKKYASKYLEYLGFPGFTFFAPYGVWRFIDTVFCGSFSKQSFIVMRARKSTKSG